MTKEKEKERKKSPSLWSNAPFTPCPQLCMKIREKAKMLTPSIPPKKGTLKG
jgi:hypothetical protein